MLIEESTIKTTAIFNQEKTHRTLLRKVWDENKKSATVLMTNPSTADLLKMDFTTMYILNNLPSLDFGSFCTVNLFSFMTTKLDLSQDLDALTSEDNTLQILQCAKETDVFIVAIGRLSETNKKVAVYQQRLFERLREYQSKMCTIQAYDGSEGLHPLSPKLRANWKIIPYQLPLPPEETAAKETKEEKVKTGRGRKPAKR